MTFDTSALGERSLEQRVTELEAQLQRADKAAEKKPEKKQESKSEETVSSRFTAQLQADSMFFHQEKANRQTVGDIQDGSAFRRARVGWLGEYMLTQYRIEFDFALAGRPTFLDVWLGWKDLPWAKQVRIGHFFEPFSLERVTPNRYMTFLERSLPDQPFAPARNLGIMAQDASEDQSMTWAVGVFRADSDLFGDDTGDNGEKAATGRITWLPWYDEPTAGRYLFHLGAAYSFRDANADVVRFRAQPEARVGTAVPNVPFFVDTGNIPSASYQLVGLEAAWVRGPFSLQSEYMYVPVNARGTEDPAFHGWYIYASYFLTGEHRPYRRETGLFDRVQPFEESFLVRTAEQGICHGKGAWEVAARLSHLDLDDANVNGGRLTDVTIGLNWYMNRYTRISANYVHAFLDAPGRDTNGADFFGMRAGIEF